MGSKSDYFENKLTDTLWRGQSLTVGGATLSWSSPPTFYVALTTSASSDSAMGTEVTGGGYARQPIVASLTNMAGTQSAGSTTASSGSNATTSNNLDITFSNMPSTLVTSVTGFAIMDALTGGNMLEYGVLSSPVSSSAGATFTFSAGSLTIQEDN